jgi:glycosyltransferase involved in cell wall biosynthesis
MPPLLTVAIPAYNRPEDLRALLDTILAQDPGDFDLLVVEDCSPRQAEVRAAVERAAHQRPDLRIRFLANQRNLGFDGNLRRILELSEGEFTFFMGDDDLLRPGALAKVAAVIGQNPNLGVLLRAYESVDYATGQRIELFRYFPEDRRFPAGAPTMRTFFRRCVSIAGFTIHTASARQFATDRFDGSLLYQLYLGTRVVRERDGYFIADVLTAMRKDDRQRHFFGSASSEKGRFAPGQLTPEHSVQFMRGMVDMARAIEAETGASVFDGILDDLSNYSYAYLRLHARDRRVFARYVRELQKLGLARTPLFWGYVAALFSVPTPVLDRGIRVLKKVLRSTPKFGGLYAGENVKPI